MTSIKSDVITIKKVENFDNTYIETELKQLGIDVVRWAVTDIGDEYIQVSTAFISS